MNYDDWKATDSRDSEPDHDAKPRGFCPTCKTEFDHYEVTEEPYCSSRCRAEGEQEP